jgi:hypothetical protein
MHSRRIAAFLLGAWLAGSLIALLACLNNAGSVDEAMGASDTTARQVIARAERDGARMLLRSLTAVENARLLSGWELAQAPIGVLLTIVLLVERPTRILVALPLVMLLLVGFEHVLVQPEIAWLSQAVSFLPDAEGGAQRTRLDNLQRIYVFVEALKLLLGVALAALLFVMRTGRRGSRPSSRMSDPLERRALG